jgi:N-hydroxyarylamine O-acetyltransferase
VPVSLDLADLERKLVTERRGGYCFEQNLLLKHALDALGMRVELMLARVTVGAPREAERPRTHLLLRVTDEEGVWHADAGFGAGTLLEPIPFGPGEVHEQAGWPFRVIDVGEELILQAFERGEWVDQYRFLPQVVPQVDVETSNWFTATHPRSPFVTGLNVASQREDGSRISLSDWTGLVLREQTPTDENITPVNREQIPGLLETAFGLPGFALNDKRRVVPSPRDGARPPPRGWQRGR